MTHREAALRQAIAAEVAPAVEAGVADLQGLTIEQWLDDIDLRPRPDYSRVLRHGVEPIQRPCLLCSWPTLCYGDRDRVCGPCKEGRTR